MPGVEVHPSLVTIPFQVDYRIPYGILSASEPSPETRQFLDIIRSLVEKAAHPDAIPAVIYYSSILTS